MTKSLRDLLISEFIAHYLAEELPSGWPENIKESELKDVAKRSALRLGQELSSHQKKELVALLEESSNDPKHPIVIEITQGSLIDWSGEAEYWTLYQRVAREIASIFQNSL